MAIPFLDTNVLLRHLLQDHPEQSPKATAYLVRIEKGELRVRLADTVIFELVFTLQKYYQQPKATIREVLLPLLDLPGIILPGKRHLHKVFDLYVDQNITFADAYHAMLMERLKISEVISLDTDFDRIKGIRRTEP